MTKNEYQKYVKELVNKSGSLKKLDEIEVEPWDLSRFSQLKEYTVKMINILFDEDDISNDGQFMVRGRSYHEYTEMQCLGCKYGDYNNGYSFYAYNNEEFLIYTYCEGDTTLTIYPDKESYEIGLGNTRIWYKKANGYEDVEEREPAQKPPKEISDRAKAIMKRFIISGSCDEMYISNVIAHNNGLGDGESHFNGKTEIVAPKQTAKAIQGAYGCNIEEEEIDELENIILNGVLERDATLKGIKNFIDRTQKERKGTNDQWYREYLAKKIVEAKEVLEECKLL